jgi:hypothetical protein
VEGGGHDSFDHVEIRLDTLKKIMQNLRIIGNLLRFVAVTL